MLVGAFLFYKLPICPGLPFPIPMITEVMWTSTDRDQLHQTPLRQGMRQLLSLQKPTMLHKQVVKVTHKATPKASEIKKRPQGVSETNVFSFPTDL